MLNRLRPRLSRPTAALAALSLPLALSLAACGDGVKEYEGLDAVTIKGEVGSAPKLDWKGTLKPEKAAGEVVTEGKGDKIAAGDTVLVDFTLANGYTHRVNYDTYDDYTVGALVKVGSKAEPSSISDVMTQAFAGQVKAGQRIGSRIAVTVGSDKAFGDYLGSQAAGVFASLDIGNEDGLLFVVDLVGIAGPEGTESAAPAWAPKIVETDGLPSSLDFSAAPKPSGKLQVATLVKGEGPVVESGQTILASYLGQIPSGKKPFDESFSKGSGIEAVVGGDAATVVAGWSQALVGLPVGSRVLIEVPPSLGYAAQAQGLDDENPDNDIPANSTLYFVIDILDAADPKPAPEPEPTPSSSESPSGSASTDPSATATP